MFLSQSTSLIGDSWQTADFAFYAYPMQWALQRKCSITWWSFRWIYIGLPKQELLLLSASLWLIEGECVAVDPPLWFAYGQKCASELLFNISRDYRDLSASISELWLFYLRFHCSRGFSWFSSQRLLPKSGWHSILWQCSCCECNKRAVLLFLGCRMGRPLWNLSLSCAQIRYGLLQSF